MATTRFYLTLADGGTEDIGADDAEIRNGGTLVFKVGREVIVYAPHAWVTFFSEVEDD